MTSNPSKSPPDWASNHWVAALLHALPLQLPLLLLISKKNFQKPHQQPPSLGSQSKVQTHHDPPHSPSPRLPPLPLCSHLPPLLTPSATAPTTTLTLHRHFPSNPLPPPPKLAYFISGTHGDSPRLLRLLRALYHPNNQYLLHLDRRATPQERVELSASVGSVAVFAAAENVNVVGSADAVNLDGSTPIASLLRGAAILLRYCSDWDWFVNLEASDYPLISQDGGFQLLKYLLWIISNNQILQFFPLFVCGFSTSSQICCIFYLLCQGTSTSSSIPVILVGMSKHHIFWALLQCSILDQVQISDCKLEFCFQVSKNYPNCCWSWPLSCIKKGNFSGYQKAGAAKTIPVFYW